MQISFFVLGFSEWLTYMQPIIFYYFFLRQKVLPHAHNFSEDFQVIILVSTRMEGELKKKGNVYFVLQRTLDKKHTE